MDAIINQSIITLWFGICILCWKESTDAGSVDPFFEHFLRFNSHFPGNIYLSDKNDVIGIFHDFDYDASYLLDRSIDDELLDDRLGNIVQFFDVCVESKPWIRTHRIACSFTSRHSWWNTSNRCLRYSRSFLWLRFFDACRGGRLRSLSCWFLAERVR